MKYGSASLTDWRRRLAITVVSIEIVLSVGLPVNGFIVVVSGTVCYRRL